MNEKCLSFPKQFLWGAATAAHQVEGNNINTDWWVKEHRLNTNVAEPSGDAADSFHRYKEDIHLLADLGFSAYRFSVEWARIEPAQGCFSQAGLLHYKKMIEEVISCGMTPVVTLHHFTNPLWFAAMGGWCRSDAPEIFSKYVKKVCSILGDVPFVCTINEPNMMALTSVDTSENQDTAWGPVPNSYITENLIKAHHLACDIIHERTNAEAGWSVANQVYTPMEGCEKETDAFRYPREDIFLEAAKNDDFIGVQAYLRTFIGKNGIVPVAEDAEKTLTGWEYFPAALGCAVRHTASLLPDTPVLVTENGIATADDARRIDYTFGALEGLHEAMKSGIKVIGYIHWSALDNYEWGSFKPTFGLISWDKQTFKRTVKPSGKWLGNVAKTGILAR